MLIIFGSIIISKLYKKEVNEQKKTLKEQKKKIDEQQKQINELKSTLLN